MFQSKQLKQMDVKIPHFLRYITLRIHFNFRGKGVFDFGFSCLVYAKIFEVQAPSLLNSLVKLSIYFLPICFAGTINIELFG